MTIDGPGPPAALECHGLRKSFGSVRAVDSVSLTVSPGEIVTLLGPSGCGKTTFLRLVAGFDTPDAGAITIGGRPVVAPGLLLPPERRRVGMVFQDYALFPNRTVAGNVRFGLEAAPSAGGFLGRLRLRAGPPHAARLREVLDLVALADKAHRYPHELSGGEAQRVALARALAPRPDLILFDEPFSNLDAGLRLAVRTEVRAILKRTGAAAVFVTHDQDEAFALGDRVAVMWQGRIAQIGSPREIYRRPVTRDIAAFVGEADFLPGRVQDGILVTEIGRFPAPAGAIPGAALDVLVRPERLDLRHHADGPAVVQRREFFGHDQLVYVRLPSGRGLRIRLGPDDEFAPGDRVALSARGDPVVFPPREA